jgi:hypothetical protein
MTQLHLFQLNGQKVHQVHERVKPDHPRRVGDEVRESVHVVEVKLPIPIVNHIFDAPNLNAGCLNDSLDG